MNVKHIVVFLLAVVFIAACGKKEHVSKALKKKEFDYKYLQQEEKEDIKAKKFHVKRRETISYFYDKYGKKDKRGYLVESKNYDEKGNLIEHAFYTARGVADRKHVYEYDENNNLITESSYDIWNKLRFQRLAKYDKFGNMISAKEFDEKINDYDLVLFEYDEDGNLLSRTKYSPDDEILEKTVNKYDSLGHKLEAIDFVGEERIKQSSKFKYDSLGLPVIEQLDIPGTLPKYRYYKYDQAGHMIEERMKHYIKKYAFNDDHDLLMDELFDGEGNLQTRFQYFYDERGLLKEKIRYDSFGNPAIYVSYKYEFYNNTK
ncbi:MAG: hypothetical protein D6830_00280 [Ignavibacteria bacterium]|nr:MAG: hypothetical protein D6830_00280 [Ignavibacteria bacterium]